MERKILPRQAKPIRPTWNNGSSSRMSSQIPCLPSLSPESPTLMIWECNGYVTYAQEEMVRYHVVGCHRCLPPRMSSRPILTNDPSSPFPRSSLRLTFLSPCVYKILSHLWNYAIKTARKKQLELQAEQRRTSRGPVFDRIVATSKD